ncbi:MAG: hypothetical protein JWR26_2949 [Pedosphaera sp.]|nr:hypothetical protein [Pedosphaera sp.]
MKSGGQRPIFGPDTSLFVGRSPTAGDAPSSRLVSSPNLWPRHPRLFMSWLPGLNVMGEMGVRAKVAGGFGALEENVGQGEVEAVEGRKT